MPMHCECLHAMQLSMTYTGAALGMHNLPVQLYIADGRRLRLDLVAICVRHSEQVAHLPGSSIPSLDGTLQLRPVQVASRKPPLQMFKILNAGPATMHWHLDLKPLEALRSKYFGCVPPSALPVSAKPCMSLKETHRTGTKRWR